MLARQVNRLILISLAGLVALLSFADEGGAYLFPHVLAVALLLMAVADVVLDVLKPTEEKEENLHFPPLLMGVFFILCYIIFSEDIGFYLGGFLFMLTIIGSYLWLQYREEQIPLRFIKHLLFVLCFCVVMYLLFSVMLQVQVPKGLWL